MGQGQETPGACIWSCGRPADSREDVLAEWIREYLGAKVSHRKNWQLKDLTPIDSAIPTLRNPRPGPRRFLRLRTHKVVCGVCNNGWMSILQDEAKSTLTSMFDGENVTLGPTLQLTLLRWGTMTAICNHYATRLEVDRSRRDHFYKHHSPPSYTEIFAAHIDKPTLDTIHGSGGWRDTVGKTARAYIDVFGIKHAALLIFQGWMPPPARTVLDRVAELGIALRPSVNLSRSVAWPVASMTTESFGELYDDVLTSLAPRS